MGTAGKEVTKNTKDFSHKNCLQKRNLTPAPARRGKDNKIVLYNLVGITVNDDLIISHNDVYLQYNSSVLLNRPGFRLQANQAVRYLKCFYGAVWVEAEQPVVCN